MGSSRCRIAGSALLAVACLPARADTPQGFRVLGISAPFPAAATAAPAETPAVRALRAAAEKRPAAYTYRRLAEACEKAKLYQQASDAYRREAAFYRKLGDPNAARVQEGKANWWDSRALLYQELPVRNARAGPAKFEPASGCYIGAIIERDDRVRGDYKRFGLLMEKAHSLFFDYRRYGMPFPTRWVERLADAHAAPQIAFEPTQGLAAVQDDRYLQAFARQAAAARVPIFLRFAGEMNGDWTRYGMQPEEYVRKWRLVYSVMNRLAPNVAMVWSPNVVPEHTIPDYYPGDAYVDWVGINMYSVHHHNNQLDHPGDREDPADFLSFIYNRYARRKPVMISEYAATHYCYADRKEVPGFAVDKMRMLYTALPRRYPRVKAVNWYDINNVKYALRSGRQTNNYSLTDNDQVLEAYRQTIRSPYFLPEVVTDGVQDHGVRFSPVASNQTVSGVLKLSVLAKTYSDRPLVAFRLDGKPQLATTLRPYEVEWDTRQVANGLHTVETLVYVNGRMARSVKTTVRVAN